MTYADRMLERWEPYLVDDDGSLVTLALACSVGFEMLEVVREGDDPDRESAMSALFDPTRAPYWFLRFLGQFVGLRLPSGVLEADARRQIQHPTRWFRGTNDAIVDAVAPTLTGTQTVIVLNRTSDADHLTVATFTDETPSPAVTEAAARAQKKWGLIMAVTQISHNTFLSKETGNATFGAAETAYSTFANAETGLP